MRAERRFVPSEKCVTSRQNPLNRYMRNSRNLHHRDVLRRSCHNIKSVIISISTRPYPFAYSDCQAAALVSTRCDFMEMLCFNYTTVSTHKSQPRPQQRDCSRHYVSAEQSPRRCARTADTSTSKSEILLTGYTGPQRQRNDLSDDRLEPLVLEQDNND